MGILRTNDGAMVRFRSAHPRDRDKVQAYFGSLSAQARYNRFLGGMNRLPDAVLDYFVQAARADRVTILATVAFDGRETIVGEGCYVLDTSASGVELALSVHDDWQGRGIGTSLVGRLEDCAAAFGALRIFGDTLRSNERICGGARAFGYISSTGSDLRVIHLEKRLAAVEQSIGAISSSPYWR